MDFLPFESAKTIYKSHFGAVVENTEITFSIILHKEAQCSAAFMIIKTDGHPDKYINMNFVEACGDGFYRYSCTYTFPEGLYWYNFCFDSPWGRKIITRFSLGKGIISENGGLWQQTVYKKDFVKPKGFSGGIIYQIFPDRFYFSGKEKENVPTDRYLRDDWGAQPFYRQDTYPASLGNDYFKGDIKGIVEKLPYIASLGVSLIYLNPIFEAHSNHRYNTANYLKIDSLLGSEDDLKELCKKAKEFGIGIILDGVFSHTGDDSIYFNSRLRYNSTGAYNSEQSDYYDWYKFRSWPNDYLAWWGVPSLPEIEEDNPKFTEFITGENGVISHWMDCGIKGLRLDVADELPNTFLDNINKAVKRKGDDNIIIGEVWEDATNKISYSVRRRYLRGGQLDSVMNYPFANAIIDFVKGGSAINLCDTVFDICENYPRQCLDLLMNHIGTHDTARVLTILGSDAAIGNREWQSAQQLSESELYIGKKRLYLAAVLQYTLPGMPSVYYGDEVGMEGYGDPFCRGCYPWGKEDLFLLDFYKKMGAFRRGCDAFSDGDFSPILSNDGLAAYIRSGKTEEVLIAVNRTGENLNLTVPSEWNDAEVIFGKECQNGTVSVEALGFTILKKLHYNT